MFCGHDVYSPNSLDNIDKDTWIYVGVYDAYYEVMEDLRKRGFQNIISVAGMDYDDIKERKWLYRILNRERCISLGKLMENEHSGFTMNEMPFINGGSGVLDYAFLMILAKLYNLASIIKNVDKKK